MICAACNKYYVDGLRTCPECGAALLDDAEHEVLEDSIRQLFESWVMVYTTNTMLEAEMLQANLESADIPVHIHSQIDSSRQLTVGSLAIVKIYVRSSDYHDAMAIIRDIERRGREA